LGRLDDWQHFNAIYETAAGNVWGWALHPPHPPPLFCTLLPRHRLVNNTYRSATWSPKV